MIDKISMYLHLMYIHVNVENSFIIEKKILILFEPGF